MPKTSHSGSSSSGHSSSGSSGGFHSSSRGVRISTWYGPRVVMIHGVRYNSRPTKSGSVLSFIFSFIMIIAFFALFGGLIMFINSNSVLNSIKADYDHYQSMITYALTKQEEGNSDYIVQAEITEHVQDRNANNKWYVRYKLTITSLNQDLTHRSYAVYDSTQINSPDLAIGKLIDVAIDTQGINYQTDSVPLDYKDMAIEQDGEYQVAANQNNIGKWLMIGSGIGIGATIILNIVVFYKCRQLTEIKETEEKDTKETKKQQEYEGEVSYCQYCGERITKGTKTCPKCGAKL